MDLKSAGVSTSRKGAGRHEEVARALGRGLEERRGLHLEELAVVQRLTQREGEVGAHLEVGRHARAAEVQVAIAQADVLGGVHVVLDLEGRRLGGVEDLDLVDEDLDLAGRELGVVHALGALAHDTGDLDRPLGADGLGRVERVAAGVLRPPWSRRCQTQPVSVTCWPMCSRRSSPQVWVCMVWESIGVTRLSRPAAPCRTGGACRMAAAHVDGARHSGGDCTTVGPGGARAYIRPMENGLLVPCGDESALCEAMCLLADDAALCRTLSQNAVGVRERLDRDRICAEWEKLL